jgi:hypothetical protein
MASRHNRRINTLTKLRQVRLQPADAVFKLFDLLAHTMP